MDPYSAAGHDGFGGVFYCACWNILKADLMKAVHSFFCGSCLPRSWTSTLLFTILKVVSLRPISLCNFSFKVVSKLLTSRLAQVLPSIISEEQSGFTQTRSIVDNILMA